MVRARMVEEFSARERSAVIGNSLRVLQLKELSLAQKEGDSFHVQGLADPLGDGAQQRFGFGETARLFRKVY